MADSREPCGEDAWTRDPQQVGRGLLVQPERAGDAAQDLLGGVLVAALLQAVVVVGADAREEGELLTAQPGDEPVALIHNTGIVGLDQFPAACR